MIALARILPVLWSRPRSASRGRASTLAFAALLALAVVPNAPAEAAPQAVKVGKTVYVAMTLPVDTQGQLISPDDMAGQLGAIYTNIATTLKANGAAFENVAVERIYTTDMPTLIKLADQRLKVYSKDNLPAVSFIEVKHLADPGFLVGVEVIAELP